MLQSIHPVISLRLYFRHVLLVQGNGRPERNLDYVMYGINPRLRSVDN